MKPWLSIKNGRCTTTIIKMVVDLQGIYIYTHIMHPRPYFGNLEFGLRQIYTHIIHPIFRQTHLFQGQASWIGLPEKSSAESHPATLGSEGPDGCDVKLTENIQPVLAIAGGDWTMNGLLSIS